MEYQALRTFIAVVEEKNFTRAGERLNLSQPAVSLHIKQLETEFQAQLLDRSPKHLYVTAAGEILYKRAVQMLNMYQKTQEELFAHLHTVTGTLRIGASFTIGEYILPGMIAQFSTSYPDVDIQVMIGNTDQVVKGVKLLQYDIGLIEGQVQDQELVMHPFMNDEMVLAVPIKHRLAGKKTIQIDELHDETWIVREEGSGTRVYTNHVIRSLGLRTDKLITLGSNQAVTEAVIIGLGITVISRWVIQRPLQYGELACPTIQGHTFPRMLSYIVPPHIERTRLLDAFISKIL
ncbi:DNA-binding transcriptional LysR family regulator [Aneurinibacillus soli]|uniref:HTH-type transcriptional regulator CysL n=1 Tax=Aneurinibacillus soli TaxID=1500254 RepID=A0A0U4WIJ3_9BACL|nr:LysR family transcriptional regulator [Aneurinibacillus soli]PYE61733.1 DNA-binding transcriptional LysR family regulator [Aneurinibacillus soli]BAU28409.1 HTH-type transcriptional regulator CysL [Aneurinibacillus soli]